MTDMYSISLSLRVFAHILRYAGYIIEVTDDADFYEGLIDVTSDYLYLLSHEAEETSKELGDTSKVTNEEDCNNSSMIKELQERVEKLSAELTDLLRSRPEQEQEDE